MYIACIDTGTTNTRVCIRNEHKVFITIKKEVGVRLTSMDGNNMRLCQGIREAYLEALDALHLKESDLTCILACGMISSNLGLLEVPHIPTPVTLSGLSKQIVAQEISAISTTHPIHFIPGVKNQSPNQGHCLDLSNIASMDIMRGEEVESFGVFCKESITKPSILILPGSHTKFVYMDADGTIKACLTTMAGEALMQFTKSTVISGALNYSFAKSIDSTYLLAGAKTCNDMGLTRAAFCVRTLEQFTTASTEQRENYLLGAILTEDLRCIKGNPHFPQSTPYDYIVCGSGTLGLGFYTLLKNTPDTTHSTYLASEDTMSNLSSFGAILVTKEAGLI